MRISSLLSACFASTRRPIFAVGLLAGLVFGGFILLFALIMLDGKRDADRLADQAEANIVDTIEHDTARTFETFDLSLVGVVESLKEPDIAHLAGKARQDALFDYAAKATYLNAILVVDETGKIIDDSNLLVPPQANLSGRDFFRKFTKTIGTDVGRMYVSRPLQSRIQSGEWSIAISRRISKPDGSFGGVVVGTLQLDYFQSLFSRLAPGPWRRRRGFSDRRRPCRAQALRINANRRRSSRQRPVSVLSEGNRRALRNHSPHGRNSEALHIQAGR